MGTCVRLLWQLQGMCSRLYSALSRMEPSRAILQRQSQPHPQRQCRPQQPRQPALRQCRPPQHRQAHRKCRHWPCLVLSSQLQGLAHADFQARNKISQPQSITQKGVHTHPLTAREREHGFFVAFEQFHRCEFRASIARTLFCAILWRSPKRAPKCSKSRDLIAVAICDSNRESQIPSDLRQYEPSQKSLFVLTCCTGNVRLRQEKEHRPKPKNLTGILLELYGTGILLLKFSCSPLGSCN